ncbi:MAG: uroporphyrinogen decarboxylase family protein [Armatimonadota bacterium]
MTPRERLLTALAHKQPDRVPRDLGGTVTGIMIGAYRGLLDHYGLQEEPVISDTKQQLVAPSEEVLWRLGIDTRYVPPGSPRSWTLRIEEDETGYEYTNEWGIRSRMPKERGYYFDMVAHPLATLSVEDLDHYDWPDMRDPGYTEGLADRARRLYEDTQYALVTRIWGSMFERAWYLRGFEQFFMDMVTNQRFTNALLDKLLALNIAFFDEYLGAVGPYVQVVMCGDDLGGQNGPLISLDLYRKYIKPRQRELFSYVKSRTDAYLFFHTCGAVYSFIPDLIEVGVDVLNPVQVSAVGMDPKRLADEFGDRLSFWGAIDTQHTLPFGTPEQVRAQVRERIEVLGRGGGYVLNAVHNIQTGVPAENIVAMFEAGA